MSSLHVTDIKAMAAEAHRDEAARERLFTTLLEGEEREASDAAWTLTHLPADDNPFINQHRDALVRRAIATHSIPLRRLTLTLLERLEWPEEEVRTDLLDFTLQHMIRNDEPYGVRSLCVKLAYQQCRHYPELLGELRQTLLLMERTQMGRGLQHTLNKIKALV